MKNITKNERLAGGLYGLLIGDALGVPYEFHSAQEIPPREQIEMTPPAGFRRAHSGTPVGTWSDDGAQALVLLDSLLKCNGFDATDFGDGLVSWRDCGWMAVGKRVFDIGNATSQAISRLRSGVPALEAGVTGANQLGNGSLMRVLPLALWHTGSDAELVRDAMLQSKVTHAQIEAQVCCAVYCLWAREVLEGNAEVLRSAFHCAFTRFWKAVEGEDNRDALYQAADSIWYWVGKNEPNGSGYVVDCLHSARLACGQDTYEGVVREAIMMGSDTDTTACVAGGIAGIRYGVQGIPQRWMDTLREKETVELLLKALLEVTA